MSIGFSITLSQDIQASNFVSCPIVGTIDADINSGESRWFGPPCSNRKTVPQLKRCPWDGTNFFASGAAKLSKLAVISENKNKTPSSTKLQVLC